MKKLLLTLFLAFGLLAANAQYKNSLGLAFGSPSGVSFKTFLSTDKALDFTFGIWSNYFLVSGMYEIHAPLADQFKWYYGPGAHVGSWTESHGGGAFLGLDGVVGIEFKPSIPIAFSLDLRPGINLIGNEWDNESHWFFLQSQFSIRYTF
jgi:hypothetical protein